MYRYVISRELNDFKYKCRIFFCNLFMPKKSNPASDPYQQSVDADPAKLFGSNLIQIPDPQQCILLCLFRESRVPNNVDSRYPTVLIVIDVMSTSYQYWYRRYLHTAPVLIKFLLTPWFTE
jgi:hypothetical protein